MKTLKLIKYISFYLILLVFLLAIVSMLPWIEPIDDSAAITIGMPNLIKVAKVITVAITLYIFLINVFLQAERTFAFLSGMPFKIMNNISTLVSMIFVAYGLLVTLTETQFSALATFIGLPFITTIPRLFELIFEHFYKRK